MTMPTPTDAAELDQRINRILDRRFAMVYETNSRVVMGPDSAQVLSEAYAILPDCLAALTAARADATQHWNELADADTKIVGLHAEVAAARAEVEFLTPRHVEIVNAAKAFIQNRDMWDAAIEFRDPVSADLCDDDYPHIVERLRKAVVFAETATPPTAADADGGTR